MKKQLLFFLCLLQVALVFSQNYPVRVTPQGIPPYPNSLSAYDNTDQLRSPINLLIEFNDLTAASRAVQLKISIEGTNITATSKAVITGVPNIILDAGFPLRLTNAELAPYFALQNLQGVSAQQYNNTLPDGLYRICFEVFDAFNGNKLSNTGCTNIFLVSSDPPFLNRPENRTNLTEQNPTNILFQWTPRHAGVPNVSYEFSLVEIWDRYADPQAVFLASPPIYQDITTATNLLYGPIQPLLLPGKRYAWRVRAIATNAGEEVSVFKNNGYSEIFWFDHASDCTPVTAVQVQDATLTTATISWIGQPEHLDYTIKYREKDGNRWYTKTTPRDYITIEEFRPDTVYEFVVLGNCDSESYGESPLKEFRTLTQELAEYTDCGIAPEDVDLSNQELLTELRKNDVFTAGDFPVYVKKVSGSTTFSGEGYISTPWLATVRIPVTFDNIKINTDKKLVDGFVITTYDPNWGSILDADAVIEEATGDPGDKNVIKVDFDIIDVQVSKDGKTVTLIGSDGQEVVREGGKDVVYQDSKGENWEVSADGTVKNSQQADGGPATKETTAGMGGSGVNEITSTDVRVDFEKGNGYYAFDPYPTVTTGTLKDAYTTIDIAGGGTYYPPYKAISNLPGHPTDILLATATFQNSEYTTEDIVFKTKEGTEIPAEWVDTTATLTLEKKFDFVKEEIIATVKPKDTTQQYTIAGTANYWHLASQEVTDINVKLISVNGASLDGIRERINQIYNPAGINFEVTEASTLAISDPTIDVGNSTLLSQYTDGEKAWIEQFKALGTYERDTYYLFVTDIPPTDADTDGFMPLKRQFGFVFAGQDKGRTAAHELGHGVFGLEHTFTEYNTDQAATNLLMDYGNGTAFTHMDWEKMHAPGLQLYWFQGDEDGENRINDGIDILGNIITKVEYDKSKIKLIGVTSNTYPYLRGGYRSFSIDKEELIDEYKPKTKGNKVVYVNSEGELMPYSVLTTTSGVAKIKVLNDNCSYNAAELYWEKDQISGVEKIINKIKQEITNQKPKWKSYPLYKPDPSCLVVNSLTDLIKKDRDQSKCSPEYIKEGVEKLGSLFSNPDYEIEDLVSLIAEEGLCISSIRAVITQDKFSAISKIGNSDEFFWENKEIAILRLMAAISSQDYKEFISLLGEDDNQLLLNLIDKIQDRSINPWDGDNFTSFIGALCSIYAVYPDVWKSKVANEENNKIFGQIISLNPFEFKYESYGNSIPLLTALNKARFEGKFNSVKDIEITRWKYFLPSRSIPTWAKDTDFEPILLDPLDPVIIYTDNNLLLVSTVLDSSAEIGNNIYIVPALFLEFKDQKEFNDAVEKGSIITLDVATIFLSGGTALATKVHWARRVWASMEVAGAIGSIATNTIPNLSPEAKKAVDAYNIAMSLIGFKNLGKGIYNYSKTLPTTIKEAFKNNKNIRAIVLAKYLDWKTATKNLDNLSSAERELISDQANVWKSLGFVDDIDDLLKRIDDFKTRIKGLNEGQGLPNLVNKFDDLDDITKSKFLGDFENASDWALNEINKSSSSAFEGWKKYASEIKGRRQYTAPNDKDISDVKKSLTDPQEIRLVENVDDIEMPFKDSSFVCAGGYHPSIDSGEIITHYNLKGVENEYVATQKYKTFLENELTSFIISEKIDLLNLIRTDKSKGGELYKKIYEIIPEKFSKIDGASQAGSHAEVRVFNEILKKMTANGIPLNDTELSKIRIFIKNKNGRNMCRCPHCYYLIGDKVKIIGNE